MPQATFCDELGISIPELLELYILGSTRSSVKTFSDFLRNIIDMYEMGIGVNASLHPENGELFGDFSFQSPKLATLASSLQKDIEKYHDGKIDKEEFDMRVEDNIKMFNVPIEEYV